MSDRIAVFNAGRVEQVGAPADVYEHPSSEFVAGFVGISNVVNADAALSVVGSPEPFTVRPEKIVLRRYEGVTPPEVSQNDCSADGVVRDVVYLGAQTRYLVEADAGFDLVVVQQNQTVTGAGPTTIGRGCRVRAVWPSDANRHMTIKGDS